MNRNRAGDGLLWILGLAGEFPLYPFLAATDALIVAVDDHSPPLMYLLHRSFVEAGQEKRLRRLRASDAGDVFLDGGRNIVCRLR